MTVQDAVLPGFHPTHAAVFSPCRRCRYELRRTWDPTRPLVMFVGLNPSTADETADDPTIRRCIRYAKTWTHTDGRGYGGLIMANLFAFRATDPRDMKAAADPIGPDNDASLQFLALQAGLVVAAWGVHGTYRRRASEVLNARLLGDVHALGLTRHRHPRHPLYMPTHCMPIPYLKGPTSP